MNKKKRNTIALIGIAFLIMLVMAGCSGHKNSARENTVSRDLAQIYLYGEKHGIESILEKEFEIWHEHYHKDGLRHLFIEVSFFAGEFLNIWMHEDNDDILNAYYDDLEGTAAHVPATKDFYQKIKAQCPETIFHGTDVGHQYFTTGIRFLEYLEQRNLKDSPEYLLALEAIEQGKYFYEHSDDVYRENKMTENFIRAFDLLDGEKIVGIYGKSHTGLNDMDFTRKIPCMAKQLKEHYGDIIYSEDLTGR